MEINKQRASDHRKLVAANWKMNILPGDAKELVDSCISGFNESHAEILICPPFTHLALLSHISQLGVRLGAQNCSEYPSGAYTGEISAEMLLNLACSWVILGHSECRARNPLENERIAEKIRKAIRSGLRVIYCCGEPIESRNANTHSLFVSRQLEKDLALLEYGDLDHFAIAYEPIWAIGTGRTATVDQASEMHDHIREWMDYRFPGCSTNLCILYGGSVNAKNAAELAGASTIDGVLVGGASLKPAEFKIIISAFS